MGETMQVVQVEVFLKERNHDLLNKVESALREEIPGCVPCRKYMDKDLTFFGLIDNLNDPIDVRMVQRAINRFKTSVSIGAIHTWDMDIDEPTYDWRT